MSSTLTDCKSKNSLLHQKKPFSDTLSALNFQCILLCKLFVQHLYLSLTVVAVHYVQSSKKTWMLPQSVDLNLTAEFITFAAGKLQSLLIYSKIQLKSLASCDTWQTELQFKLPELFFLFVLLLLCATHNNGNAKISRNPWMVNC